METTKVKEGSHENELANQVTKSIVANNAEQSEICKLNIEVNGTDSSMKVLNNLDQINKSSDYMHELSNETKDIELNLTGTNKCLLQFHFAVNLTSINLSNNELKEVPAALLTLKHLQKLNLSHNKIKRFDETPFFIHTLQELSLANNSLVSPPLWLWKESPQALLHLDISNNEYIVRNLTDQEEYEFLNYTLTVNKIILNNCRIDMFREILLTLVDVKELSIGVYDYSVMNINEIKEFPCKDLECYNVEKLHLSHVKLYNINESINYYKSLTYLDLSSNNISHLPNEFGDLNLLKICKLSFNKLLYLPDTLLNLKKLKALYIDNNTLYVLPDGLFGLPELICVDVYQNCLEDKPSEVYDQLNEIDFAQNYFSEPEDAVYIEKKTKLRIKLGTEWRIDGKKERVVEPEPSSSEYESDYSLTEPDQGTAKVESEEDWDSDTYWEPSFVNRYYVKKENPWVSFIKKKMMEGNFCPLDLHEPNIMDKINYARQLCPQPQYMPVEGQFDDLSDDDS